MGQGPSKRGPATSTRTGPKYPPKYRTPSASRIPLAASLIGRIFYVGIKVARFLVHQNGPHKHRMNTHTNAHCECTSTELDNSRTIFVVCKYIHMHHLMYLCNPKPLQPSFASAIWKIRVDHALTKYIFVLLFPSTFCDWKSSLYVLNSKSNFCLSSFTLLCLSIKLESINKKLARFIDVSTPSVLSNVLLHVSPLDGPPPRLRPWRLCPPRHA